VTVGEQWQVRRGDCCSSCRPGRASPPQCDAGQPQLDLFRFADTPIFEAVHA
jgi:gentisate 1,2-dioxygenase